jgi:hypothetical protein
MDTVGNTFILSEVQLEVGPQSTPFEHEPVGVTLSKAQRYFMSWNSSGLSDNIYLVTPYATGTPSNSSASAPFKFPVTMRANPTMNGTGLSLSRFTSNGDTAVMQMGSTSSGNAYSLSAYTADAEL